jgi:hypothetical protein
VLHGRRGDFDVLVSDIEISWQYLIMLSWKVSKNDGHRVGKRLFDRLIVWGGSWDGGTVALFYSSGYVICIRGGWLLSACQNAYNFSLNTRFSTEETPSANPCFD